MSVCPPVGGVVRLEAGQGPGPLANVFFVRTRGCQCPFVFSVGPAGTPCNAQCIVADVAGNDPIFTPPNGPCQFNPDIIELPLSGLDCNGNGEDDIFDIVEGVSADANENLIPHECEPVCPADFNADDTVNSQGFFDFLAAFFKGCP
jgi:hypothetical protein